MTVDRKPVPCRKPQSGCPAPREQRISRAGQNTLADQAAYDSSYEWTAWNFRACLHDPRETASQIIGPSASTNACPAVGASGYELAVRGLGSRVLLGQGQSTGYRIPAQHQALHRLAVGLCPLKLRPSVKAC